jgi:hypothetical protein
MTTIDPNTNIIVSNLVYDYPSIKMRNTEISGPHNSTNLKFLNATYINNTSIPNINYTDENGINYLCYAKKLYIYGLLHNNIKNVTNNDFNIIGELIIEHNMQSYNKTNDSVKNINSILYSCYLLKKYNPGQLEIPNDIDNLLYLVHDKGYTEDIKLNNSISRNNKCIVYNDGPDKFVMINTEPILVVNDSFLYIKDCDNINTIKDLKTLPFSLNPIKYKVIDGTNISLRKEDDIYIDCQPTGSSENEIATTNSPLNEKEKTEFNLMKTTVDFCIFTVGLLIASFGVPIFYKTLVIDTVISAFSKDKTKGKDDIFKRIRSVDISIILFYILLIISLVSYGNKVGDIMFYYVGLFFTIFLYISVSIVVKKKEDRSYMSTYVDDELKEFKYDTTGLFDSIKKYTDLSDVFQLFVNGAKIMIDGANLPVTIAIIIFYAIILACLYFLKVIKYNLLLLLALQGSIILGIFYIIILVLNQ